MKLVKSETAVKAVVVGLKERKTFRPMTQRGLITEPFYADEWWYEPYEQSKSVVPAEAMRRVELLRSNGIGIKGMVIAHEAPLILMAPEHDRQVWRTRNALTVAVFTLLAGVAVVVAIAVATPVAVVAAPVATSALSLPMLLTTAVLVDPALVVVLEDGTWLEVCRWDESYD